MANLSNINNKFLFTDGDFLKIGNLAPINNISGTESGISVTNSNVASITLDNTAASGKTFVIYSDDGGKLNFYDVDASSGRLIIDSSGNSTFAGSVNANSTSTFLGNGAAAIKFGNTSTLVTMSYSGTTGVIRAESGSALRFDTNGVNTALTLDTSQNATFAGDVFVSQSNTDAVPTNNLSGDEIINISNNDNSGVYSALKFRTRTSGAAMSLIGLRMDSVYTDAKFFIRLRNAGLSSSEVFSVGNTGATFAGNVKIGNSTTGTPAVNADDLVIDKGASESGITLMSTAAASIRFGDAANTSIGSIEYNHNSDYMRMIVNNAERMRIDSSGHTKFTKSTGGIVASFYDGTYGVDLAATATGASIQTFNTNQTLNFNTYGTGDITFTTSGTSERMRIDSSGRLGLGVTPLTWSTGVGKVVDVMQLNGNGALFTRADNTFLSQNFYYNSSDIGAVIDAGQASIIQLTAGNIVFSGTTTGASSGSTVSVVERMRITSGGAISLANANTSVIGRPYGSGTINNGQSVVVNLNPAGGNQAGGFLVISAVPNNTSAGGAVEIWTHIHTQGANVYSKLSGQEENSITITESGGSFTISNSSGSTVYYNIKVLNLTDFASTIAGT